MLTLKTCTRVLDDDTSFPFTSFCFEDLHKRYKPSVMRLPNSEVLEFARVDPVITLRSSESNSEVAFCVYIDRASCHEQLVLVSYHVTWKLQHTCSVLLCNISKEAVHFWCPSNLNYTRLILFFSSVNSTNQWRSLSPTAWRHMSITFLLILLLRLHRSQHLAVQSVSETRFKHRTFQLRNRNVTYKPLGGADDGWPDDGTDSHFTYTCVSKGYHVKQSEK
jgi:hypothetical protein